MRKNLRKFGLALAFYVLALIRMALILVLLVSQAVTVVVSAVAATLIEYGIRPIDWLMRRIYPDTPKRVLEDEHISGPNLCLKFQISYEGLAVRDEKPANEAAFIDPLSGPTNVQLSA